MRWIVHFLVMLLIATNSVADTEQVFTITSRPMFPGDLGLNIQAEFVKKLEQVMQVRIKMVYKTTICQLLNNAEQQGSDILIMAPRWVPFIIEKYGYRPLLKIGQPLSTYIISHKDNPVNSFQGLRGKIFGLVKEEFTRELLVNRELDRDPTLRESIKFKEISFSNTLLPVINREVDAAAVSNLLYDQLSVKFKNRLHYFKLSSELPLAILLANKNANETLVQRYVSALGVVAPWTGVEFVYSVVSEKDINQVKSLLGDSARINNTHKCK